MAGLLKLAVRDTIKACEGIDKAGRAAGRSQSTAGLWNNLSGRDMPPVDCAVAIDSLAIANGAAPHITAAMAAELGQVLVALPAAPMTADCWNRTLADLANEHGDLLAGLLRDLADRKIAPHEAAARRRDAQALLTVIVEVDLRLRAIAEGEG